MQDDRESNLLRYQDGFDRKREADRRSRRKVAPLVAWIAFEGFAGTFAAAVVLVMMIIAVVIAVVTFAQNR